MTGPRRGAWGPRACVHVGLLLAGARPVHLRPGDATTPEALARLDGVVVTGGHDVEPVLYKAEPEVRGWYDPERDRFEAEVIRRALEAERPLLTICRGTQLLNVVLGGSLMQDLNLVRKRTSRRRSLLPIKSVEVVAGTTLAECLGTERVRVNSLHRQGIARIGEPLRVSGRDLDGIVQAVEHPARRFVVGVQWHPEFLLPLARQRRLFRRLVAAGRAARTNAEREG